MAAAFVLCCVTSIYVCFVVLGVWFIKNVLGVAVNFHKRCRIPSVSVHAVNKTRRTSMFCCFFFPGVCSSVIGRGGWFQSLAACPSVLEHEAETPKLQSVYEYVLSAVCLIAVPCVEEGCCLPPCFNTPQSSLCSAGILLPQILPHPLWQLTILFLTLLSLLTKPPFIKLLLNVLSKDTSETESLTEF